MNDQKLNIRQFKMMNGEEIIGLVNQKEPSSYIIERPFQIKPTMMGGFSLLPWFPFSSQKLFKIEKEFIMHSVEIDEDMKTEYIKLAASSQQQPKPILEPDRQELLQEFDEFVEDLKNEALDEFESEQSMKEKRKETLH
jgi:hypothetical protein